MPSKKRTRAEVENNSPNKKRKKEQDDVSRIRNTETRPIITDAIVEPEERVKISVSTKRKKHQIYEAVRAAKEFAAKIFKRIRQKKLDRILVNANVVISLDTKTFVIGEKITVKGETLDIWKKGSLYFGVFVEAFEESLKIRLAALQSRNEKKLNALLQSPNDDIFTATIYMPSTSTTMPAIADSSPSSEKIESTQLAKEMLAELDNRFSDEFVNQLKQKVQGKSEAFSNNVNAVISETLLNRIKLREQLKKTEFLHSKKEVAKTTITTTVITTTVTTITTEKASPISIFQPAAPSPVTAAPASAQTSKSAEEKPASISAEKEEEKSSWLSCNIQ